MQKVKLPIKIDPVRCAAKRLDYVGIAEADKLIRLGESTVGVLTDVEAALSFGIDAQGLTIMQGTAHTLVKLECQRCNEAFEYRCEIEFVYTPLLKNTVVDELPEAYEPIELDENGEFDLYEVLEDEFILALPIVPMHPLDVCPQAGRSMTWGEIEPADERPNPFAVLNGLKNK
ncbi:23S rRNA accumulation protein YceD [Pseudaeromonas sp. ZJS20]|uniref:23S rRNA accumulation protein YceD n=1 Tax=Pseudaeromonas aegiceratis TaxID=3153928 RepID=UPI00390CD263